jgi:hypothetical protein
VNTNVNAFAISSFLFYAISWRVLAMVQFLYRGVFEKFFCGGGVCCNYENRLDADDGFGGGICSSYNCVGVGSNNTNRVESTNGCKEVAFHTLGRGDERN